MRFVISGYEPSDHTGMEFMCDFCNAQWFEFGSEGYYVYLKNLSFPSYWVCEECKIDLEGGMKIE